MLQHRQQNRPLFVEVRKPFLHPLDVFLGSLRRGVDGVVGEVEEKRFLFLALDECHRLLRQTGGQVPAVIGVLEARFIAVDRGVVRALDALQLEVIVTATAHELVALVEAAVQRVHAEFRIVRVEAHVPFADNRAIIIVRQKGREDFRLRIKSAPAVPGGVDAQPLLVQPKHQAGASRRTHRTARVGLREKDPLTRQCIHVWRSHLLRVIGVKANVCIPLIVCQNNDNIWRLRLGKNQAKQKSYNEARFCKFAITPNSHFQIRFSSFLPGLDTCPEDGVFELEVSKKESKQNGTHIKSILNPENEFVGLYIFFLTRPYTLFL